MEWGDEATVQAKETFAGVVKTIENWIKCARTMYTPPQQY